MDDTAITLAVLGGCGLVAGWWLRRLPPARRRRVALGALALLALPLGALVLAGVLRSEALGWLAGLTLMISAMVAVPVLAGLLLGWTVGWMLPSAPREASPPVAATPVAPRVAMRRTSWAELRPAVFIMAGVAAGFVFVLGLGFRLHDQRAPGVLHGGLWPALAVLLALMVPAGRWIATQVRNRHARRRSDERYQAWREEREHWLRQLALDPRRQPYLARIRRGEHWTAERVDYDLDPDALACCRHLQPLERALRRAALRVLPIGARSVQAECVIDADALARQGALPAGVAYSEPLRQDRDGDGEPMALLHCGACQSSLWTLHARRAPVHTPRFPSASNN